MKDKTPTAEKKKTKTHWETSREYYARNPNYSPHDAYEDARLEARIEAQEEYEDQQEWGGDDE